MQRKHSRHRDRLNAQNCGKSSKLFGNTYLPNALKNCALRRSAHTKYQFSGSFINSIISKGVPCTRWPSFVVLGILKNKLTSRKQHHGSHGAWGNKAGRTIHNKSSFSPFILFMKTFLVIQLMEQQNKRIRIKILSHEIRQNLLLWNGCIVNTLSVWEG